MAEKGISMEEATDLQKVYAINDYLCKTIDYDLKRSGEPYNQTAYSGLVAYNEEVPYPSNPGNAKTVCAGYTASFELLCDIYDVPCISVTGGGYGKDATEEEKQGRDASHIWNYVLMDGFWYIMDVTWNDGDFDGHSDANYDYSNFLIGETTYLESHTPTGAVLSGIKLGFPTSLPEKDYLNSVARVTSLTDLAGMQEEYMAGDSYPTEITGKALLNEVIDVDLQGRTEEKTFSEGLNKVPLLFEAEKIIIFSIVRLMYGEI